MGVGWSSKFQEGVTEEVILALILKGLVDIHHGKRGTYRPKEIASVMVITYWFPRKLTLSLSLVCRLLTKEYPTVQFLRTEGERKRTCQREKSHCVTGLGGRHKEMCS